MIYTGAEFSNQDLFEEMKQIVLREKITTFDEYEGMADALIEEKRSLGLYADQEDLSQIKRDLELYWPQIQEEINKNADKIID